MNASLDDVAGYVRATAMMLDLPLDAAQVQRVATHLARTKVMAGALAALPLAPEDEPTEIFCPAPFPTEEDCA
jgi:hypothetical protein